MTLPPITRRNFLALGAAGLAMPGLALGADMPGLARFQNALRELAAGKRARVDVLVLGDSHVAADYLTDTLRDGLQSRYGNGGRGLVQPPAYPFYRNAGADIKPKGNWQGVNSRTDAFDSYGLTGVALRSNEAGAALSVTSPGAASLALHFARQGDGGVAVIGTGDSIARLDTAGDSGLAVAELAGAGATITLAGGALYFTGAEFASGKPGVRVSNLGLPGATGLVAQRWNSAVVAEGLKRLSPQLIIWAYGVNEAFQPTLDVDAYAQRMAAVIALFASYAPEADWLIAGPGDALRNAGPGVECGKEWILPVCLGDVRRAQRRIAAARGAAFWDWADVMGGGCSMNRWVKDGTGQADHVHFTETGYQKLGENLLGFLLPKG